MDLTIKQTEALDFLEDNSTLEVLYGGGAGGGKSVLGCYWLLKCALKYPGSRYLMARATAATLRQTTLNTFWYVARMQQIPTDSIFYNEGRGVLKIIPSDSEIIMRHLQAKPSDPNFDELGSLEITGAFIDECNQISERAWNVVRSRIRYRLNDFGLLPKMLGTCNPSKGFVYQRFYKPAQEGALAQDRRFVASLVDDNPYISKHYKKSLQGLDERSMQRLLLGNWEFENDPMALMNYESILNIFSNHPQIDGQRYITADIARFGDDSTVLCLWSGWCCERIFVYSKLSIDATAKTISDLARAENVPLSNIVCDEDGVGGGVADILKCKGFVNNSSAMTVGGKTQNFSNLKSQCYFMLADRVNKAEISIRCSDPTLRARLIEELEQVKAVDLSGEVRLAVVSKSRVKEILGRSPDVSDAVMMRMFFALRRVEANKNLSNLFT